MAFDVASIRAEFPILTKEIDGKPLVYLDNAATTQKPWRDRRIDITPNATVMCIATRTFADEATKDMKQRAKLCKFINANESREVIWTSGTTESINILANGFKQLIQPVRILW